MGLGERLPAPGTTAGSAPAALLWWGMVALLPPQLPWLVGISSLLVVGATAAGWWAAEREAARRGIKDPGAVVIDEVAGQWLTFLVALPVLHHFAVVSRPEVLALGFLTFRVFDVAKPWPVSRLERLPGGLGIMADDLAAAVYAGLLLIALVLWLPL